MLPAQHHVCPGIFLGLLTRPTLYIIIFSFCSILLFSPLLFSFIQSLVVEIRNHLEEAVFLVPRDQRRVRAQHENPAKRRRPVCRRPERAQAGDRPWKGRCLQKGNPGVPHPDNPVLRGGGQDVPVSPEGEGGVCYLVIRGGGEGGGGITM